MTTKVQNQTVKHHIEISGLVLTNEAIETLKGLQENGNSVLKSDNETIADAVCFLSSRMDVYTECERERALELMRELSMVRDQIKSIAKP